MRSHSIPSVSIRMISVSWPSSGPRLSTLPGVLLSPIGQPPDLDLAVYLTAVGLQEVVVLPGLRIFGDFLQVLDRAGGDARAPPAFHPLAARCGAFKTAVQRSRRPAPCGSPRDFRPCVAKRESPARLFAGRGCSQSFRPVRVRVLDAQEQPLVLGFVGIPERDCAPRARLLLGVERSLCEARNGCSVGARHEELRAVERGVDELSPHRCGCAGRGRA